MVAWRRIAPEPIVGSCLSEDKLAALTEGRLATAERASALAHVATCSECRARVGSLARLLADAEVAREVRSAEANRPRWRTAALPVAIAAMLLLVLVPLAMLRRAPGPEHRAPPQTITEGIAPESLRPAGVVAAVDRLTWAPVAGADRYRATLFTPDGRALYEIAGADTVAPLPDSVRIEPGRRYFWQVEARVGIDRWSSSGLIEFEVARSR